MKEADASTTLTAWPLDPESGELAAPAERGRALVTVPGMVQKICVVPGGGRGAADPSDGHARSLYALLVRPASARAPPLFEHTPVSSG